MQPWRFVNAGARAVFERGQSDVARILAFQEDPPAFARYLAAEGVDAAVLVNYVAPEVLGFPPQVNDWVAEYARAGGANRVPMGSVNPRATPDAAAEVARVLSLGIRALKVNPPHQLLAPNDERLYPVYAEAERRGVPVTIHTGTSVFPKARIKFGDPVLVDDVAVDFPRLRILLAHAGRDRKSTRLNSSHVEI